MLNVTVDEIQRDPLKYLHQVEAGETLVICQALQNRLTIATVDPAVRAYPASFI